MAGNQIEEAAVVRIQDAPRAEARDEEPCWFYLSRGGNGHDERRIRRLAKGLPEGHRNIAETRLPDKARGHRGLSGATMFPRWV